MLGNVRCLFKLGVVRSLLEVLQRYSIENLESIVRNLMLVEEMLGGILFELRAVRILLGECEVFDRVGSCKEMLGEM